MNGDNNNQDITICSVHGSSVADCANLAYHPRNLKITINSDEIAYHWDVS